MPESLAREIGLLRTLATHLERRPLPFECENAPNGDPMLISFQAAVFAAKTVIIPGSRSAPIVTIVQIQKGVADPDC